MGGYDIVRHLLPFPSQSVLLKLRDESMLGAGLLPDDYVVVQQGVKPALGNLVIAVDDGNYTIREWAKDDDGYYLRSANEQYDDIRLNKSPEVYGVVTGSFRSYNSRCRT